MTPVVLPPVPADPVPPPAPGSVLAQPPTRKFDAPGAPPFQVLKDGENPPLDAYDNFVVGPNYLTVNGRTITFVRGEALSMDGGAGNDTFIATTTSMAFASLIMRGGVGGDVFVVSPPTTTTMQVFGDAPNTLSGGDSLRVSRAGALLVGAKPSRTAKAGTLSFAGRGSIIFAGIESYQHPDRETGQAWKPSSQGAGC